MKTLIFVPYFGTLPSTFSYWLNGCNNNPEYNWLIFTDDRTTYDYPSNVSVIYTTLSDLKEEFSEILGFKAKIERPYKLCDYRPLFGVLFAKYLAGYTHWGYCDLDLVLGKLSDFISSEMLDRYAKIHLMGHLTIVKNQESVNRIYTKCDYRSILESDKSCAFDELYYEPNFNKLLIENGYEVYKIIPHMDIGWVHYCFYIFEYNGSNRIGRAPYPSSIVKYDNGQLYQLWLENGKVVSREIAYAHFQKRKMSVDASACLDKYYIVPNMISSFNNSEKEILQKYSRDNKGYTFRKKFEIIRRKLKI